MHVIAVAEKEAYSICHTTVVGVTSVEVRRFSLPCPFGGGRGVQSIDWQFFCYEPSFNQTVIQRRPDRLITRRSRRMSSLTTMMMTMMSIRWDDEATYGTRGPSEGGTLYSTYDSTILSTSTGESQINISHQVHPKEEGLQSLYLRW